MIYGSVPPRKNEDNNRAYPVRLTIRANVALPDALGSYGYLNRIDTHFQPFPKTRRSLRQRKMVYTGYITEDALEIVLDIVTQYEGVTATVVCL